ncbi:MAG TPA: hypothetical protein VN328_09845, partial [Thermodesulfovibrionales bacterium]|nr:hypothetical protein [Thermodesulfovibrionales bacterium]
MEKSKIIGRIYDPFLNKSLNNALITVLIGPRQSGKTTSANGFLDNISADRKFYLNLDSSFERNRVGNSEN